MHDTFHLECFNAAYVLHVKPPPDFLICYDIIYFHSLAETVKRLDQLESSVPPRLQMRLSADGKSLETVVKSITAQNVPVAVSSFDQFGHASNHGCEVV